MLPQDRKEVLVISSVCVVAVRALVTVGLPVICACGQFIIIIIIIIVIIISNKNFKAIANRSHVSCINTSNITMTLKSGLIINVIESGAIQKLGCSFLFAFYSNYGLICSHL